MKIAHDSECKPRPDLLSAIEKAVARSPAVMGTRFLPWVGQKYDKSGAFGRKRVLVVGASHYEWCKKCAMEKVERGEDTTCRCVIDGFQPDGIQHWRNIEYAFFGKPIDRTTREAFWQAIAYYNFVQRIVGFWAGGRKRAPSPTPAMWHEARSLFPTVLRALRPDLVVVLGSIVW